MKTCVYLWPYLTQFFLEYEMCQTKFVEKIKTHVICSTTIFWNHTFYEIMWKSVVEVDTAQMTIWRMRIACCIHKAINTHSEYVILIAFLLQQWLYERVSVVSYSYIACLV
jgi:hypothetical protein